LADTYCALRSRLFAPVDIASLVYFRVAFGAIMLWEVWRYFDRGWIDRYYVEPTFYFTYYGFDWVRPWPAGWMMDAHFYALAVLAVLIILGLWYRVSAALFFIGFTYIFLLDQSRYLNHFYLISILGFLLIFIPAHRAFSIDAARRPDTRSDTAPAWSLWILRAQIAILYLYGGLAKLNGDWLRGEPMREWLAERTDFPLIGRWFTEEWMVYLFSYGGLLLDLFIVPFLLWKRTRPFALLAALAFHLTNNELFPIGIFPWLAIAATLLFLPPEWPRLVLSGKRLPMPMEPETPAGPGSCSRETSWLACWQFTSRYNCWCHCDTISTRQRQLDGGRPPFRLAHEAARQGRRCALLRDGPRGRRDLGG
jgi:vitamin K-dependent gamma-carboxylase